MQNNSDSGVEHVNRLKDENLRLLSENAQLKKDLEKELLHHRNLFKQWKELNEATLIKDREADQLRGLNKRGIPRPVFYSLLCVMVLLASINAYYLFFNTSSKDTITPGVAVVTVDSLPAASTSGKEFSAPVSQAVNIPPQPATKAVTKDSANSQKTILPPTVSKEVVNEGQPAEKTPAVSKRTNGHNVDSIAPVKENVVRNTHDSIAPDKAKAGLYKVKSKAYLYNNPDENSRRNAFIVHWDNAYGTLTPLQDKNGFIYIEFKNHLGQVSKGWVRKIDLDPI